MSIPSNLLLLGVMLVVGIATLNVISSNGNTMLEVNDAIHEFFSATSNSVAKISIPIDFLKLE